MLIKTIKEDLVQAIEESSEKVEAEEIFADFDDGIDREAGDLQQALEKFRASIEEEVVEARETVAALDEELVDNLGRNKILSWTLSVDGI